MASSDEFTHNTSSGSDSDRPYTPSPAAPRIRASTRVPFTAPSKIPTLKATPTYPVSLSPPHTPAISAVASSTLDWGGGDWSRLADDIERKNAEMRDDPMEDDSMLVEPSISEHSDPAEDGELLAEQSTSERSDPTENGELFAELSTSEHADPRGNELLVELSISEHSDPAEDGELLIDLSISEDSGEQTTTTDSESLQSATALSGSSSDYDRATHDDQPASQSKELETSDEDESHTMPDPSAKHHPLIEIDQLACQSEQRHALSDIDQPTCEPGELQAATMPETELSDPDTDHVSDSDQSVEELPTVRIRGPFINIATKEHSAEKVSGPSPQTILRGLIRDAHREMMYFTLPHSHFSLGDLRQGLDFAYSMLQAATTKLAILAVLYDDMTDMSATDIRRWIAHVDHLDPQTRYEPRMLVIFESLSAGEIKIALAELVQSRLIVEDEVKQTRELLMQRVTAKEQEVKASTSLTHSAVDYNKQDESISALRRFFNALWEFFDVKETGWDALLTAVMVGLIGTIYLCIRE